MRKMEKKSKQPSHSILSSGIRNLRPATTSLSHCSQTTRSNSVVRTGRSTNSLYRANQNQQDRKSRTPSISSRRRPVFPLPGLVIGGRKRTRTHSRSSGKGGCEPLKQRPGGCWPVNRLLLARKPIHAELAGNGRMDRIDGAADPTASSSCLTSSKQSIGSAK